MRELARVVAADESRAKTHRASAASIASLTSLVPIQPHGSAPPLFCMHAGAGSVLFYYPLGRALAPSRPVYALQAQGADGRGTPHDSIPAMAAHYLREIRTVQPVGPYHLAGFCLGATIGFEMAQQLHDAGEEVALLASFDGIARGFRAGPTMGLTVPQPHSRLEVWRKRMVKRFKQTRNRLVLRYHEVHGGPVPVLFRHFRSYFHVNNGLALSLYYPRAYAGVMHVFMAQGRYADPRMGWERWVDGPVITHEIEGELIEHRALLTEPMVSRLAREIESVLAEDTSRDGSSEPTLFAPPASLSTAMR